MFFILQFDEIYLFVKANSAKEKGPKLAFKLLLNYMCRTNICLLDATLLYSGLIFLNIFMFQVLFLCCWNALINCLK